MGRITILFGVLLALLGVGFYLAAVPARAYVAYSPLLRHCVDCAGCARDDR